jgi:hypothetical protein
MSETPIIEIKALIKRQLLRMTILQKQLLRVHLSRSNNLMKKK